jgi:PAS domain S-box-containing protein
LLEARHCYERWGAEGKVTQLENLYPHLKKESRRSTATSTVFAPAELLDLATVIKVSQTVSGEMVLEKLIDRLLRAALQQAGAERGLLITPRRDDLQIEAEATAAEGDVTVRLRDSGDIAAAMPESLVRYVMRSQESVILDDASSPNPFAADPYIVQRRPRSILTLPLINLNQSKLISILYLENNLTPHVFTPDRITVLKVLASQAATSLENTRLYRDLEDRERRIRRLVDANIMGIFSWNLDGQIVGANEAFLDMVQFDHEDVAAGRVRWTDLTPHEWREHDEGVLAELKTTGTARPYEKEYFRKDGSRVPVLVAWALFEGGGDEGVAFALDLSEQKHAEEALRQSEQHLAHINRVSTMGELTASLAHEIKQPIAAATTDAQTCMGWLTREVPDIAEAREAAARLIKDVTRANEVIGRIGSLFKKHVPMRELVDVNELIREMIGLMRSEANRYSISIRSELAEDLPQIMADRVGLQQVLMNLMLNGLEAMRDMPAPGTLTIVSRRSEDGQLSVSILDTGVGISSDQVDKIFSAFVTSKAQGTGMGLPISRSIIESHGGRLWATPNTRAGATFQFVLPMERAAQQSA